MVGNTRVKKPLWGHRHKWDDNTKIDIQELICCGMESIELALDPESWRALLNAVINFRVP